MVHAVAQMLQCNSANLALIDEDRQALVLAIGVTFVLRVVSHRLGWTTPPAYRRSS